MALTDALVMTSKHASAGAPPLVLLDYFVRASGLACWEAAGAILHQRQIIQAAFSADEIQAVRHVRRFLEGFNRCRVAYAMAVAAQEIPAMSGDVRRLGAR